MLLESKARDAIPFSDKANAELNELFDLMNDMLKNFRDLDRHSEQGSSGSCSG